MRQFRFRLPLLAAFAGAFGLAGIAFAQSDTITLLSKSGRTSATGTFVGIENGAYLINTVAGTLRFPVGDVECVGDACPSLASQDDQQVTLTAKDGSTRIQGNLQGVEAGQYVVEIAGLGVLRFDLDGMLCTGTGCPPPPEPTVLQKPQPAPSSANAKPGPVRIAGDRSLALGLLPMMLEQFVSRSGGAPSFRSTRNQGYVLQPDGNPDSHITVSVAEPRSAFEALATGAADLIVTSRRPSDTETAALRNVGLPDLRDSPFETVIAVDQLALVSHPDNPVRRMNLTQIADIYTGKLTNWSELGGPDLPIVVMAFAPRTAERAVFDQAMLSDAEGTLTKNAALFNHGGDLALALRETPGALGYVRARQQAGLAPLTVSGACAQSGVATPFGIRAEDSLLAQRFYAYQRPDAPSAASALIAFARHPDSEPAFMASLFEGFSIRQARQTDARIKALFDGLAEERQSELTLEFLAASQKWDRLSATLRFAGETTTLQGKALADVSRLITYLGTQPAGTEIQVVGFSTATSDPAANVADASQLADTALQVILEQGGRGLANVSFETRAYGDLAPPLCITHPKSGVINRRVEIWVRNATP